MFTKMISAMKHTKDRMDNPMPVDEMKQLLDVLKSTGATHIEVATVIGHPRFKEYSEIWGEWIHAKGMKVTWRCAHQNMEGLYNAPKFVGGNRKPTSFWIDEAFKAAKELGVIVKSGDEWAIYPERTEGIFNPDTAFMVEGLPGSYAQFFIDMNQSSKTVLPSGVVMGLSANNASELLSGWMNRSLSDFAGMVVVDHYRDGDPVLYEKEIRDIKNRYGKPVYVQEGAPHRFTKPTRQQADEYYAVNKKLASEGVLGGFGSWSGWAGNPESIVDKENSIYVLNENGKSLTAWWEGIVTPVPTPDPVPDPVPTPVPTPTGEYFVDLDGITNIVALTNKGNIYKYTASTKKWNKIIIPDFS